MFDKYSSPFHLPGTPDFSSGLRGSGVPSGYLLDNTLELPRILSISPLFPTAHASWDQMTLYAKPWI